MSAAKLLWSVRRSKISHAYRAERGGHVAHIVHPLGGDYLLYFDGDAQSENVRRLSSLKRAKAAAADELPKLSD